jgi:recombination protein U
MENEEARRRSAVSNAVGFAFENYIKAGCIYYRERGMAEVTKTPEPFRVTKKHDGGIFTGRFVAHAEPDFQGTLAGGRAICFEAKYTASDRMKRNVLTDTQMTALARHAALGAFAGVCVGIIDKFFFVPWNVWQDMKERFGRLYVTAADIKPFRVRFNGAVLFLDRNEKSRPAITETSEDA